MQHRTERAFTLIEIMVVIAIIGILSVVVLVMLGTTRAKGGDAAIQSDMHTVQSQAEFYYYNHNYTYGIQANTRTAATCEGVSAAGIFTDMTIKSAMTAAIAAGNGTVQCFAGDTAYAIAVQLKTSTNYQCIDSTGKAKSITSAQLPAAFTTTTLCP